MVILVWEEEEVMGFYQQRNGDMGTDWLVLILKLEHRIAGLSFDPLCNPKPRLKAWGGQGTRLYIRPGAHEPPKAAKERVTREYFRVPCKYKSWERATSNDFHIWKAGAR